MSEEELFESTFPGYKALIHDGRESAKTGKYQRKPSNMFRVWMHGRTELAALKAGQGEAVAYAQAWCAENEGAPAEFLSYSLLVKRSEVLGRKLTWRETIELTALTSSMSDAERDALLAMDDAPPATGVIVPKSRFNNYEITLMINDLDHAEYSDITAALREYAELRALLAQQEVKL